MGIPMGIPTSPEYTVSPTSPLGPKEMDDGLGSARRSEKRICGLRKRHFWELLGFMLALVLAAAIIGGVVGGLHSRNQKSSSSRQPESSNTTSNTTNSTTNTTSIPLQYVHT